MSHPGFYMLADKWDPWETESNQILGEEKGKHCANTAYFNTDLHWGHCHHESVWLWARDRLCHWSCTRIRDIRRGEYAQRHTCPPHPALS